MLPRAYIGKFGRQQALNDLNPNIVYTVLYDTSSNHFWKPIFPNDCECKTISQIKKHVKNSQINFIIDLGWNFVSARLIQRIKNQSILIASRLLKDQYSLFRVIDDEIQYGFRVPVEYSRNLPHNPPCYEDCKLHTTRNDEVSPPKYEIY